jgi:hypothetical protein
MREIEMNYRKLWAVPLAMAGCAAVGAALTLRLRQERRHIEKQEHREGLRSWEGEGGSPAAPAQHHS